MADEYYPIGAFHFSVKVLDPITLGSLAVNLATGDFGSILTSIDASFQEVTGIESQFEVEEVVEGGENRFVHRLPRYTKYSNLVLKRGIVTKLSFLAEWFGLTIGSSLSLPIIPMNVMVMLLNEDGWPAVVWFFAHAYPVRWEIAPMDSMDNKILTERLEFSYNYFQRVNAGAMASAITGLL
ncbi:MAG: phage tail protein [Pyrinomonadaceae bacterium]